MSPMETPQTQRDQLIAFIDEMLGAQAEIRVPNQVLQADLRRFRERVVAINTSDGSVPPALTDEIQEALLRHHEALRTQIGQNNEAIKAQRARIADLDQQLAETEGEG